MFKEILLKMATPLTLICFMTIMALCPLYLTMGILTRTLTEKTTS